MFSSILILFYAFNIHYFYNDFAVVIIRNFIFCSPENEKHQYKKRMHVHKPYAFTDKKHFKKNLDMLTYNTYNRKLRILEVLKIILRIFIIPIMFIDLYC